MAFALVPRPHANPTRATRVPSLSKPDTPESRVFVFGRVGQRPGRSALVADDRDCQESQPRNWRIAWWRVRPSSVSMGRGRAAAASRGFEAILRCGRFGDLFRWLQ